MSSPLDPSQKHQYQERSEEDVLDKEAVQAMRLLEKPATTSAPLPQTLDGPLLSENLTRIIHDRRQESGVSNKQVSQRSKAGSDNGPRAGSRTLPKERYTNDGTKEENPQEEELMEPLDLSATTEPLRSTTLQHYHHAPLELSYPLPAAFGQYFQPPPPVFFHHGMMMMQQQQNDMQQQQNDMQQQNPVVMMQQHLMMYPGMYMHPMSLGHPPQGTPCPPVGHCGFYTTTTTPSIIQMKPHETTEKSDKYSSRAHESSRGRPMDQQSSGRTKKSSEYGTGMEGTAFDSTDNALQWAHLEKNNPASPWPNSLVDVSSPSSSSPKRNSTAAAVSAAASHKKGTQDVRWAAHLEQLRLYKHEHGDCVVPRGYPPNPQLASWVAEQRKQYNLFQLGKPSSITPERINILTAMDFAWNAQSAAWARQVSDLKAFKQQYGHCHVPLNHAEFPKLGLWVKEQRRHYTLLQQGKPSHMTPARKQELTDLGFCWDAQDASWLERLRQLQDYKERHGTVNVPSHCNEYPKLATWVQHQRRQYKKWKQGKPATGMNAQRAAILQTMGLQFHQHCVDSNTTASPTAKDPSTIGTSSAVDSEDHSECKTSQSAGEKRSYKDIQNNPNPEGKKSGDDNDHGVVARGPYSNSKQQQQQQVSHVPKEHPGIKNVKHDDDTISYNPNDITWDGGGFDDDNHYGGFLPPSPEHPEKRSKLRITEV